MCHVQFFPQDTTTTKNDKSLIITLSHESFASIRLMLLGSIHFQDIFLGHCADIYPPKN